MKPKTPKKLILHRETVRSLRPGELAHVAGGYLRMTRQYNKSCTYTGLCTVPVG